MADPLLNISRHIGSNPVGITSLRLFLPEDVATAPRAYSVPNLEGDIELKGGKDFYTIQPDPRSAGHIDELKESIHGDYHEQTVAFDARRLSVNIALLRARLRNRRVHVICSDVCGLTHYFPNMRLRRSRAENPGRGYQGTQFTFRSSSVGPAVTLNGSLLDDRPTATDQVILLQPTTGQKYLLTIGGCAELITVPIVTDQPEIEVAIDNYTVELDQAGELTTVKTTD